MHLRRLSQAFVISSVLCLAAPPGNVTFRQAPPGKTGIRWSHENAHSDHRYLPETIPPGVAIFDYNNDGWMDLLFVNTGESVFFHPKSPLYPALYRNNRDGTFTDVTAEAGLKVNFFGMGAAVGDYDGDGYADLLLTGYGKCYLFHNNGNGTFTDVTAASGISVPGWSTSAVWFDYNNDGKPDLLVAQFVDYSSLKSCGSLNAYGGKVEGASETQIYYCIPRVFDPMPSHLYRNDGGGRFTDVSKEMGILESPGKGFGVVATDINNDGYLDLFQANDTVPNFLFANRGGKKFEEIGLPAGVAYSEDGLARSGMGVDAADFDQDGNQDLFVANVDQETFSIYRNNGDETFADLCRSHGIAGPTRLLSGWGLRFFDYDNDGAVDLFLANGHPDDLVDKRMAGVTYLEPLLLFHNDGHGKMVEVSQSSGEVFHGRYAARGLAVGDLNNDGYLDVVVGINGGPPLVLYNNGESANHWVGLRLVGSESNRDAVGAYIRWSAGGVVHSRFKTGGGSFLSSHDPRDVLGLGENGKVDWIEIHWPKPSTRVERLTNVTPGRYLTVIEGKGIQ
ncbi:MAG: CRTAC1 family protein [Bryobacteraceae bacterium]